MSSHQFHCLTAAEYVLAVRGYDKKIIRGWEHTREIVYSIVKPKQSKRAFWPLPTDRNNGEVITESRLMEVWAKAKQRYGAGTQNKD